MQGLEIRTFLAEEGAHDSRVLERATDFRQSGESRLDTG